MNKSVQRKPAVFDTQREGVAMAAAWAVGVLIAAIGTVLFFALYWSAIALVLVLILAVLAGCSTAAFLMTRPRPSI